MHPYDHDSLLAEILEARMDPALDRLRSAAARDGYPAVISGFLEPVLNRIGGLWKTESISLAQSYIAGKVAESVLEDALKTMGPGGLEPRGVAILGNIEEDFHPLGRRMVSAFLKLDGWEVLDLGNDVPPARFVSEALSGNARIIGASAMMLSTALNIRGLRDEMDRAGISGKIPLAVGGAVFNMRPGLVEEVGGDGTAVSAMDAPALFRSLCAGAGIPEPRAREHP